MTTKIHTDSEALYAIRDAIIKFAGSMQEARSDFSQSFEQMNDQIVDHIERLRTVTEGLEREKRNVESVISACEDQKREAERNRDRTREGSTDSFVCRNDACGVRMMLKVRGDTTVCRSCGGTMHRVYTGGEYNRYNTEAAQLGEKITKLQEKVRDLADQIRKKADEIEDVKSEFSRLRAHQEAIITLLTFSGNTDPETVVAFIGKVLGNLDDYRSVSLSADASFDGDEAPNGQTVNKSNAVVSDSDITQIIGKDSFTAEDRSKIREAIRNGEIGEQEIRTIGTKIRTGYDRFLKDRQEEFEYLQSHKRDLAMRFAKATTDEERQQVAIETNALREREEHFREKYDQAETIKNVLASYREIGPAAEDKGQTFEKGLLNASQPVIEAIDSIRAYLPTEWVEKSNEIPIITKHVNRGYFNIKGGQPTIALSGAGSGMQRCAFHEMGHFFEQLYPEIRKLEHEFYNRRTAGEDLQWLGIGYSRSEVTRFDQFISPYMGKDYGNTETSGYELFSMGMESVFANSYDLTNDPEYMDLIFGILTVV